MESRQVVGLAQTQADVDDLPMYEVVANRRTAVDNTMWQVPTMSLTGQAFLLSIALSGDTSRTARSLAAALSMVLSVLSIQLMARLRRLEIMNAEWLQQYELRRFGYTTHGTVVRDGLTPIRAGGPLAGFRSFRLWIVGLSSFGLVGLAILLIVAVHPQLF